MAAYETVIILDPTLTDEQAQAILDDIQRRLTEEVGVEILVADLWGRRKLAYEIDRKSEGNYMFYRFTRDNLTTSIDFSDLERHLRFSEGVMRFMITSISDAEAKAPVLRPEVFSYSARPSRGPGRPDRFGGPDGRSDRRPEGGDGSAEGASGAETAEASAEAVAGAEGVAAPATEAPEGDDGAVTGAAVEVPKDGEGEEDKA